MPHRLPDLPVCAIALYTVHYSTVLYCRANVTCTGVLRQLADIEEGSVVWEGRDVQVPASDDSGLVKVDLSSLRGQVVQ